jgi:hypothetical protein
MTVDYTFDEIAMFLSSLVVYLTGFMSFPLFFFGFACVNIAWLHIIDPESKAKEYGAYGGLIMYISGFILWSSCFKIV